MDPLHVASVWRAFYQRVWVALKPHSLPLAIVACASGYAQYLTIWGHRTYTDVFYDSKNYLAVAHRMVATHMLFNHLRTPVYPGFLAAFIAAGFAHPIATAIAVQCLLMLAATGEVYLLAWRLTGNRWTACVATTLLGANLYVLQWERAINSEGVTNWLLVTCFLILECYLRRPRGRTLAWLTGMLLVLVLTRPFYVYVPFLVLGVIGFQAWRRGQLRHAWRNVALALAATVVLLGGYAVGNGLTSGYYGLSDAENINLFGQVLDCGMQGESTDPHYARVAADVNAYVQTYPHYQRFVDPWPLLYNLRPEYQAHGNALVASYSKDIILHHPGQFLACTIPSIPAAWLPPPVFYGGSLKPLQAQPLASLSEGELLAAYLALPLVALASLAWVWRRPTDAAALTLVTLLGSIALAITLTGLLSYDPREYYRLRSPLDWGMVLGAIALTDRVGLRLAEWAQQMIHAWRTPEQAEVAAHPAENAGLAATRHEA